MRKLKLQVQVTVDGFMGGPQGELDWMDPDDDEAAQKFINELTDSSDTILMGRGMAAGFIEYWESVKPGGELYDFAQKMVTMPKIVFSKTLHHLDGKNVRVENGDLVTAVNALKAKPGKDIIVYGGAKFDAALIEHGLIDEMHLCVNPTAIGSGLPLFTGRLPLELTASRAFKTGVVVNTYRRRA